jgi:hypothetical protein
VRVSSDYRHTLLTDAGPVTVLRAFVASTSERAAALRPEEARRVLADVLHHGAGSDHHRLVRLHALACGDPVPRARDATSDRLIPLVLDALEEGRVLVITEARGASWSGLAEDSQTPPDRAGEVALGLARLRGAVALDGTSYRIAPAARWRARDDDGESWEVVSQDMARWVLERCLASASGPEAPLLREAVAMLADTRSALARDGLFVLRRVPARRFPSAPDAEPALSPSQLRKQKADDWVEFVLVDEQGNPLQTPLEVVLSDGRKQTVTPDGSGLVQFSALVPGQCQVTISKLKPAA